MHAYFGTCTLHEGSYENAPNKAPAFNIFGIDKLSRLALALRLIFNFFFFNQRLPMVRMVYWCGRNAILCDYEMYVKLISIE